jgi:GTP-binding protein LepA
MTDNIRNFCIIAHIDHGKTTLSDRLLQITGTLPPEAIRAQHLDSMDLERERGITIKAHPVRLIYRTGSGTYVLNLIDTPGHVDFAYEVSRSLAACEGALLLVDAAQGVEAQTLANAHLALEHNLTIIPVVNKIDLPGADPSGTLREIEEVVGLPASQALLVSAKHGTGVREVLEAVVERVPPPGGRADGALRALVFDSRYDTYRGVIPHVRVVDGSVRAGDRIRFLAAGGTFEVAEVGAFAPEMVPGDSLSAGEVGYLVAAIRDLQQVRVGDTIAPVGTDVEALPGYRPIKPFVFCGFYPQEGEEVSALRAALEKLRLNDAALSFEPESSPALGLGFRCGFLGLLHMEVVQERLEREHGSRLVATSPNVVYLVRLRGGETIEIDNPAKLPDASKVEAIEEPYVRVIGITPSEYLGALMELHQERRAEFRHMEYLIRGRVVLTYEMPLAEMIADYYDQLKSRSRGYASLDYEVIGYRATDLVRVDVLVKGKRVDALSAIVHTDRAYTYARSLVGSLRDLIPRQLFEVPLQAAIGSKIIARETIPPLRKDVTAKLYGGDVTRKRKLLEKQKEGKQRMKRVGAVEIPQEAFLALLRRR